MKSTTQKVGNRLTRATYQGTAIKKKHYFVTFSGQWQIVMLRVTSSNAYVCIMHARKSH